MEGLNEQNPEFATEMASVQLDFQAGKTPDKDRLLLVASGIETAVTQWEILVLRLKLSGDFQTREYAKLTEAHLQIHGVTPDSLSSMMRWQAGCFVALANNTPPPTLPADLDLQRLMGNEQNSQEKSKTPSMTKMSAAEKITSNPFNGDESIFDEPVVKEEYETLVRDHDALIDFGASFAAFDPSGKLAYIDQIEQIEERWDIFFARFSLTGQLNPRFQKECTDFLASMNMNEIDYRDLLKKAHDLMRAEAEEERNNFSF